MAEVLSSSPMAAASALGSSKLQEVSSVPMEASALAFASCYDLPFLAAGSARGSPNPGVAFFRSAAWSSDVDLLELVGRVWSPAPCRRLSWSRPAEATCSSANFPTGLVAAGLENGAVAIWDPRLNSESASTSRLIEEYFVPKERLQFDRSTGNLAIVESGAASKSASEFSWVSPPQIIEDYFVPKHLHSTGAPKHLHSTGAPKHLHSTGVPKHLHSTGGAAKDHHGTWMLPFKVLDTHFEGLPPTNPAEDASLTALLYCHSGPVQGLSFNPTIPHFLASAAQEKVVLWDLVNTYTEKVPTLQFTEADNVEIADLSWNYVIPSIVSSASNDGIGMWDITVKSPLIRKFSLDQSYSIVEWSPFNKDVLVAARGAYCDLPTLKVWDARKLDQPMHQLCELTNGIVALSWSPFHEDVVVACTRNKKILIVNVKKGEVLCEHEAPETCVDIQWSKHAEDRFAVASPKTIRMYRKALE